MTLAAETVAEAVRARIGASAHTDHPQPFDESELPAWRVTYDMEQHEAATLAGTTVQHRLPIKLQGIARDTGDALGALNAMAATALPLVFAPPIPYGLEPAGEIVRELQGDGQAAVGVIEIPLLAHFFTAITAPETIL